MLHQIRQKNPNILPQKLVTNIKPRLRCVRDNLAGIRGNANPMYAARIDNGEIEEKFVRFYTCKFSLNHTPKSILTDGEKNTIVRTIRNLVVKDEKQ